MIKERKIKSSEIKNGFEKGKRKHGIYCSLIYQPNLLSCSRTVVIVGKRLGNAVKRNRIKRRYKEILRLDHNNLVKGYDLIILPRKETILIKFQFLKDNMIDFLNKEGLREKVI